jgi:hypothetical protein
MMPDQPSEKPPSPLAPAESPAVIAHLNMLQGIITRLAGNSAQCKTWCITIVAAVVAFAGALKNEKIVALAIIPLAIFGFLDAAYLANEKAYRDLYNRLAAKIRDGTYRLADCFVLSAPTDASHHIWAHVSWSVWPVYLGLIVAYLLARFSGLLTY